MRNIIGHAVNSDSPSSNSSLFPAMIHRHQCICHVSHSTYDSVQYPLPPFLSSVLSGAVLAAIRVLSPSRCMDLTVHLVLLSAPQRNRLQDVLHRIVILLLFSSLQLWLVPLLHPVNLVHSRDLRRVLSSHNTQRPVLAPPKLEVTPQQ
jgi:hypothetical protein